MKTAKNGKIEFLRFVFTMSVFLFHVGRDFAKRNIMISENISFFGEGRIGVDFFFLVSGYLAAASIYKNINQECNLAEDTGRFMIRKIKGVWPYHILVIIATLLFRALFSSKSLLVTMIEGLPNIFFLQMSGLPGKNLINVEWYISSMLLALCILYPICKKYYLFFTRIIAPITGYLIIGYLIREVGCLGSPKKFLGFTYAGNIRAVGVICLGMFAFEMIRIIKESETLRQKRLLFTIVEIIGYALVGYYMMGTELSAKFGGTMLFVLTVAVAISFSELSYGSKLFNNKFCYMLGKITLPLYMLQNLVRTIVKSGMSQFGFKEIVLAELLLAGVSSIILIVIVEFINKCKTNCRRA